MTLQDVLNRVHELMDNTLSDEMLTSFVNQAESSNLKLVDIPKNFYEFKRLADTSEYILPIAVKFKNISEVILKENYFISKVGFDHDEDLPGYRESVDGNFQLFPVATVDDTENTVKIVYKIANENLNYETDKDLELIAEAPFDEMYELYTMAKIAFFNQDYGVYNNLIDQYNQLYNDYKIFIIRKEPSNNNYEIKNLW
jgi:hypothetical protein